MDQDQKKNTETSLKNDLLVPCFGPEKEAWRQREGYCTYEEGLRLTQDAAKGLILIEND